MQDSSKILRHSRNVWKLNCLVLVLRLFGEMRIPSRSIIPYFSLNGLDYLLFSGTLVTIGIVLIWPIVYRHWRMSQLGETHAYVLQYFLYFAIGSFIWSIIKPSTTSDPVGVYMIYGWNWYVLLAVNGFYIFKLHDFTVRWVIAQRAYTLPAG
jgi:hypothetical protein